MNTHISLLSKNFHHTAAVRRNIYDVYVNQNQALSTGKILDRVLKIYTLIV